MLDDTHALCIGVSAYVHIRRLSLAPIHDATELSALLKDPERGRYRPDRVRLLLNEAATRAGLLAALDDLAAQVGPKSTVFISFAGHGCRWTTGARTAVV